MLHRREVLIGAALLAGTSHSAFAAKRDDTLNVVLDRELQSLDPYFLTDHFALTMAHHVFDTLIFHDPVSGGYKPLLAESWTWSSPTALDLTLRKGVRFHDGAPFSADDVVATFDWATAPGSKILLRQMVGWIAKTEKTGDMAVRIHMKQPTPAAIEYLATGCPIYSHKQLAVVGEAGLGGKPIGTGPYRVTAFEAAKHWAVEVFPDYFPGGPKGKPAIGKISVRTVKDLNLMIAELLSGRADLLWRVPADQAERLKSMANLQLKSVNTLRAVALVLDAAGRSGDTPLKDARVRQAIKFAINRDAIVKNLARGGAQRLDTPCSSDQVGCPAGTTDPAYDPERSKKLLADAGFANGVDLEMTAPGDKEIAEAIISDLAKVGIRVRLNIMIWPALRQKWGAGQLPMIMFDTGFWGVSDASIAFGTYFNNMEQDMFRDAATNAAVQKGNSVIDAAERSAAYKLASDRIVAEAAWVPLYTKSNNYVMSANLDFQPTYDEINRFYWAKWK